MLKKAEEFARIAFIGKARKSGENYIEPGLRIVELLKSINITDPVILTAGLLNDVIKIGKISEIEIQKNFGDDVLYLLNQLTEISNIAMPIDDKANVDQMHKLFIHLVKDIRILIIRLADRADNLMDTAKLDRKDQVWIAKNAKYLYSHIAKSVGLQKFVNIFEDESFKILEPDAYNEIVNNLKDIEPEIDFHRQKLIAEIENYLTKNNIKYDIQYRTKSIYSIYKKIAKYMSEGKATHSSEVSAIYDLMGIRILVDDVKTCYNLLAYVIDKFEVVYDRYDDYIANPRPSGYKSLQIPIKVLQGVYCSVQIRTFDMHEFNEYGAASHFNYKNAGNKSYWKNDASWIKSLIDARLSIQKEIASESPIKLFENEIFVFTPKNQVITLPKDSTVVDFAYAIHTDIGNTCTGGMVNNKLVKLDTKLRSGDVVKVLTRHNKKPSRDWLEFVKTYEARRQIQRFVS